jgi:hypothetical protein
MAKTVADLGPEVSKQYAIAQQIMQDQVGNLQESGRVSRAAVTPSVTPQAAETTSLLGLDKVRQPFAWFSPPAGYGVAKLEVFGRFYAGSLGDTPRLKQLIETVEGLEAQGQSAGKLTAEEKNRVLTGLQQLASSSELHDEINILISDFLKA